jgi:hypothetical protein
MAPGARARRLGGRGAQQVVVAFLLALLGVASVAGSTGPTAGPAGGYDELTVSGMPLKDFAVMALLRERRRRSDAARAAPVPPRPPSPGPPSLAAPPRRLPVAHSAVGPSDGEDGQRTVGSAGGSGGTPLAYWYRRSALPLCSPQLPQGGDGTAEPIHLFTAVDAQNRSLLVAAGLSFCQGRDIFGRSVPDPSCAVAPSPMLAWSLTGGSSWECGVSTVPTSLLRTGAGIASGVFWYVDGSRCAATCVAGGLFLVGDPVPTRSVLCTADGGITWTESASLPEAVAWGTLVRTNDISILMVGGMRPDNSTNLFLGLLDPATCSIFLWVLADAPQGFGARVLPVANSQIDPDGAITNRVLIGGGFGLSPLLHSSILTLWRDTASAAREAAGGEGLRHPGSGGVGSGVPWLLPGPARPGSEDLLGLSLPSSAAVQPLADLFLCQPCERLDTFTGINTTLPVDGPVPVTAILSWGGPALANTTLGTRCFDVISPAFRCFVFLSGKRLFVSTTRDGDPRWMPFDLVLDAGLLAREPLAPGPLGWSLSNLIVGENDAGMPTIFGISRDVNAIAAVLPTPCLPACGEGTFPVGCPSDYSAVEESCRTCRICAPGEVEIAPCLSAFATTGAFGGDTVCAPLAAAGTCGPQPAFLVSAGRSGSVASILAVVALAVVVSCGMYAAAAAAEATLLARRREGPVIGAGAAVTSPSSMSSASPSAQAWDLQRRWRSPPAREVALLSFAQAAGTALLESAREGWALHISAAGFAAEVWAAVLLEGTAVATPTDDGLGCGDGRLLAPSGVLVAALAGPLLLVIGERVGAEILSWAGRRGGGAPAAAAAAAAAAGPDAVSAQRTPLGPQQSSHHHPASHGGRPLDPPSLSPWPAASPLPVRLSASIARSMSSLLAMSSLRAIVQSRLAHRHAKGDATSARRLSPGAIAAASLALDVVRFAAVVASLVWLADAGGWPSAPVLQGPVGGTRADAAIDARLAAVRVALAAHASLGDFLAIVAVFQGVGMVASLLVLAHVVAAGAGGGPKSDDAERKRNGDVGRDAAMEGPDGKALTTPQHSTASGTAVEDATPVITLSPLRSLSPAHGSPVASQHVHSAGSGRADRVQGLAAVPHHPVCVGGQSFTVAVAGGGADASQWANILGDEFRARPPGAPPMSAPVIPARAALVPVPVQGGADFLQQAVRRLAARIHEGNEDGEAEDDDVGDVDDTLGSGASESSNAAALHMTASRGSRRTEPGGQRGPPGGGGGEDPASAAGGHVRC